MEQSHTQFGGSVHKQKKPHHQPSSPDRAWWAMVLDTLRREHQMGLSHGMLMARGA